MNPFDGSPIDRYAPSTCCPTCQEAGYVGKPTDGRPCHLAEDPRGYSRAVALAHGRRGSRGPAVSDQDGATSRPGAVCGRLWRHGGRLSHARPPGPGRCPVPLVAPVPGPVLLAQIHREVTMDYPTCIHCYITGDREGIVLCPLHAAAPELLEALEALGAENGALDFLENAKGNTETMQLAIDAARAAIAKARP